MVRKYGPFGAKEFAMSGKWELLENTATRRIGVITSMALLSIAVTTPALSQGYDDAPEQVLTTAEEDHQRFEAERMRQERLQLEQERRKQEKIRFEIERLRRENERHKQEQLLLENERLRQENERRAAEQRQLEFEAQERERAQTAALQQQAQRENQRSESDIYEQLRRIGELRDEGILTEEEFQRLKSRILN